MKYLINYQQEKDLVQLLSLGIHGYEIIDETEVPQSFIYAPYVAIIKGAALAIKNNILIYSMQGWESHIGTKIDGWFGKSFPLKFKYHNKEGHFWINYAEELLEKSLYYHYDINNDNQLNNNVSHNISTYQLLEKAIIFIFGALNRIYIYNPNAIQIQIEQNYFFETYSKDKAMENHLEEFNLFSDASVKEFENKTTIAGLIKNKDNEVLTVYREKVSHNLFTDSNLAEMLAITEGLKIATDMGIQKIKIFTDSMCAVENLQKYSPYYKDIGLFSDNVDLIMAQIKLFKECKIIHIKRYHNKMADAMTNF